MSYREKDEWKDLMKTTSKVVDMSKSKNIDILRILNLILPRGKLSFIELGCTPARWMVFFNKRFGYDVYGMDYENCDIARANLKANNVEGEVWEGDVFDENVFRGNKFDVVFSAGLIEHFDNYAELVKIHADISNNYVVILIPNLKNPVQKLRKKMMGTWEAHVPISKKELERAMIDANIDLLLSKKIGFMGTTLMVIGKKRI